MVQVVHHASRALWSSVDYTRSVHMVCYLWCTAHDVLPTMCYPQCVTHGVLHKPSVTRCTAYTVATQTHTTGRYANWLSQLLLNPRFAKSASADVCDRSAVKCSVYNVHCTSSANTIGVGLNKKRSITNYRPVFSRLVTYLSCTVLCSSQTW